MRTRNRRSSTEGGSISSAWASSLSGRASARAGLSRRVAAQAERVARQRRDPAGSRAVLLGQALLQPQGQLRLALVLWPARRGALLGLNPLAKPREQRIVGVLHKRTLICVSARMRI